MIMTTKLTATAIEKTTLATTKETQLFRNKNPKNMLTLPCKALTLPCKKVNTKTPFRHCLQY